jgi:hypothetical protein
MRLVLGGINGTYHQRSAGRGRAGAGSGPRPRIGRELVKVTILDTVKRGFGDVIFDRSLAQSFNLNRAGT